MLNEELPTEVWVFAGVRMERWNLCDFRRIPATCLKEKHTKAILCQIAGERPTAGARADNDKIVFCCLLFWVKSRVSQWSEDTPPQDGGAVY